MMPSPQRGEEGVRAPQNTLPPPFTPSLAHTAMLEPGGVVLAAPLPPHPQPSVCAVCCSP